MPYCPGCGNQHAADDRFCSKCGRAFVAGGAPAATPPPVASSPAPAAPDVETVLWEGTPHGLLNPIESHAIRWIVTTQRLRIVRGILSRSTEEIELVRVRDVSSEQGLTQRALGIGSVIVVGTDATAPRVILHDVEDPENVKEIIRQAVQEQRRRFHVRQVETGDTY